ncbi:Serine/threonine-protein kinase PknD [Thalassoglobus neptunius]|uniref:Serine/threonine-protein kinase PknD n=1 Tax=Thalassoglobus neptunius TaxID=1938619 RepID=A0A5C5WDK8_9PLAN|nr:WD40 repeat domain-containing serine/threonine-protein kinase [Thalassoglobus neptunius]TWT48223.1 Serine/threonine-protein kinase PknD [Thalassoglobus neptunius]
MPGPIGTDVPDSEPGRHIAGTYGPPSLQTPAGSGTGTAKPAQSAASGTVRLPNPEGFKSVYQTSTPKDGDVRRVIGQLDETSDQSSSSQGAVKSEGSVSSRSRGTTVGKGTWKLSIRERSMKGDVSGVRNRIPEQPDEAFGFLSALVDDPEVSEYEILGEVGKGNMGIVYEALQSSLNRELAIKSLKPSEETSDYEQEMFVSEAVVTANLVHPNIVPIHDLGRTDDGKLFYSMKKVTGKPWDKEIRNRPLEENLDIFMKLCDAVAYAHSRGVINRDLKPENVIVGRYGEVIVLDWGLAVTTAEFPKNESILQDFRGGAGTPVYMAPELVSEDVNSIGNHTDIYLLGAILFEILEGFPPHLLRTFWAIENPDEQFASIVHAVMTNQIEQDVNHPGELMDIATKAMSTDPQERFSSVESMQEAIRQYRITGNAEEFYHKATSQDDDQSYDNYQSSIALFTEALHKWPSNQRALVGNKLARKGFSKLALARGDYDLGLHVIEGLTGPDFNDIRRQLRRKRRSRTIVRRTWAAMAVLIVGMAALVVSMELRTRSAAKRLNEVESRLTTTNLELTTKNQEIADAEDKARTALDAAAIAEKEAEEAKATAEIQLAEAEKAREIADKAIEEAQVAAAEAETATESARQAQMDAAKAQMELKTAEAELSKAESAQMLAEQKANSANAAAEEAIAKQEMLEEAVEASEVQLREVQERITRAGWESFVTRFELFTAIGRYEEAELEINEALKAAESGDAAFEKRKRTIFNLKRDLDRQRSLPLRRNLQSGILEEATIGRTGRVIASVIRSGIEIFVRQGANPPFPESGNSETGRLIALNGRDLKLAISPVETHVAAIGPGETHLWDVRSGEVVEVPLQVSPSLDQLNSVTFSRDGRYLFIAGDNDGMAIEVFDLGGETPKSVLQKTWKSTSYKIADFQILADRVNPSMFHILFLGDMDGSRNCKYSNVNLQTQQSATLTDAKGLTRHDERIRALPIEFFSLSQDSRRLAVGMGGDRVFIFPVDPAGENPFENVLEDSKESQIAELRTDGKIRSFAFSENSERLLLGLQIGLIEVWDWDTGANSYLPEKSIELWSFDNRDDEGELESAYRIAGFSRDVLAVGFVDGSPEDVIAIGGVDSKDETANSMVQWSLPEYSDYRAVYTIVAQELAKIENVDEARIDDNQSTSQLESPSKKLQSDSSVAGSVFESEGIDFAKLMPTALIQETDEEGANGIFNKQWKVARSTQSARFSRDGERIIVGADDRAAHVYERGSGMFMWMMGGRQSNFYQSQNVFEEGHIPELSQILFLPPDGNRLVTRDFFGSISVWDATKDEDGVAREISRLLSSDFGFAVSPDGKWIFASGREIKVRTDSQNQEVDVTTFIGNLWQTSSLEESVIPQPTRQLVGEHNHFLTAAEFSPSSQLIGTADRRGTIVVWNVSTGSVIARAEGEHGRDQVSGLSFLSEDELITTGYDGTIQRWVIREDKLEPASESEQFRIRLDEQPSDVGQSETLTSNIGDYVIALSMSPDRRQFATLSVVKTKHDLSSQDETTSDYAARPKRLRLMVWSVESPHAPITLATWISRKRGEEFHQGLAWSSDGQLLAHLYTVASQKGETSVLNLYQTSDWSVARRVSPKGLMQSSSRIAFAPSKSESGEELLATFDGRVAHLWSLESGTHQTEFRSHETVYAADFSHDRKYVATASESVRVFSADEENPNLGLTIFRLGSAHSGRVDDIRFSQSEDSYDFVTLGGDGLLKFWAWNPGLKSAPPTEAAIIHELSAPHDDVDSWKSDLDWSVSMEILCATFDGKLTVLEAMPSNPDEPPAFQVVELEEPREKIEFYCCAISKDEQSIAAGGVRLGADGRAQGSFACVWRRNPDGKFLLEAEFDGEHSSQVFNDRVGITAVQFVTEEGFGLLTGGADGSVLEWDWIDRDTESDPPSRGERIYSYPGRSDQSAHEASVTSIDVSNNGDIVSTAEDGYVCFWPLPEEIQ